MKLVGAAERNVTIERTLRKNPETRLCVLLKRILRKYNHPPDKQEKATQRDLEQADIMSEGSVSS